MDTLVGTINLAFIVATMPLNSTKSAVLSKHDMMALGHGLLLKPDNLHREVVVHFCDRVYLLETNLSCILMFCITLYCRSKYQDVGRDLIYRPCSWLVISKRSGAITSANFVLVSSYDHVLVFNLRVFTGLREFRVR